MEDFYWPIIGIFTGGGVVIAFLVGLLQRRWTWRSLYVAIGCLFVALLNMVAPFRGTLDPAYVGYSFGLLRLEPGIGVGLMAGTLYLGAFAATVVAIRNRDGPAMWIVAGLSVLVLTNIGGYLLASLFGLVPTFRIELGEYFRLSPLPAALFAAAVSLAPFAIGLPWSVRKARSDRVTGLVD